MFFVGEFIECLFYLHFIKLALAFPLILKNLKLFSHSWNNLILFSSVLKPYFLKHPKGGQQNEPTSQLKIIFHL